MGIRRRLSSLWEETRDGILRGPGVDVDSVNTEKLLAAQIPTDVSEEYSPGTWYQNTDGTDKIISIKIRQTIDGDSCGGYVDINDSQTANEWLRELSHGTGGNEEVSLVFVVPERAYWRFSVINGGNDYIKEVLL